MDGQRERKLSIANIALMNIASRGHKCCNEKSISTDYSAARRTRHCSHRRDYIDRMCLHTHTCCHNGTYVQRSQPLLQCNNISQSQTVLST